MKVTKRITALLTAAMIVASNIAPAFASSLQYDSPKNEIVNGKLGVIPAKLKEGEKAEDFIKNPAQPAIYSLRTDYLVQKGEKYEINYQPYIASVGEAASPEEQAKVNQNIKLPDLAGYDKADNPKTYKIDYSTIKTKADGNDKTGDANYGYRYEAYQDFRYQAIEKYIKIKNIFQDMNDFTKYTNPDGTITDAEGNVTNKDGSVTPKDKVEKDHQYITKQKGNTGSTMQISPLDEKFRRGFVPESDRINMQVPEDSTNFVVEYRYNRAHYNVDFDCKDGTPIPTRTLYYEQEIPKIDSNSIPTKTGCDFLGWEPSHDLKSTDGRDFKKGEIITNVDGTPALDLDVNLKMPALDLGVDESSREKLTFTAVWKDKEKADYAIQFWAEKADHADNASILDKYDYIGTRVYKQAITGSTPNLDVVPVDKIKFPDLDQARLEKIWAGEKFYGDKYLLLNKFFVYNKDLTAKENADPKKPSVVKSVSATGKTVYNIYYDRQVYDLYFTKSNVLGEESTFYPEIYVPDGNGGAKLAGGPGNPYHYTARFNQLMLGWPNDAMQTKGFDEGKQSYGWGPNYGYPQWPIHLDTPPYRLNADEFLDMPNYDNWGGYVDHIDKGDGTYIDVNNDPRYKDEPYKALSFGIKQDKGSMPHHMDFWMDGFKDGETIIRYDLYRSKADTNSLTYGHKYSHVQGFTPYGSTIEEGSEEHGRITEDDIDTLNEKRGNITPYPDKEYTDTFGFNNALGQMVYKHAFFNNADPFGDPDGWEGFDTNGYIRFKYHRNKYPLRFNYDPSKIKDDSEFNETNQIDTYYQLPLKVLSPDLVDDNLDREDREYFKKDPKNLLDDPKSLQKLGLTDLIYTDKEGKLKVKRPDNLSEQMVFKGWALDPAGKKLVWENKDETMPTHPVNLYAKWGEPDYKWKVTFDPNGGSLPTIDEETLTTKRQTIQEGDIGQEEKNTYARKGYANEPATTKDGKQIFTVIQRQKLVKPKNPTRKGYDFMGWEVIRYKKDSKGEYTEEVDDSYRTKYGVPELYTFGNDVVGPIYLKAVWNPNQKVDVKVYHHFLDKDCKNDVETKDIVETLANKRTGYYTATVADKQGQKWILAPHDELMKSEDAKIKETYEKYNKNFAFNNTYFQNQRIEPLKIKDPSSGDMVDNPNYKGNEFHFFYRPFRQREYQVNFIDERGKAEIEKFYKELKLRDVEALKNKTEYTRASDDEKKEMLQELYTNNKEKFENNRSKLDKILEKYRVVDPESVTDGNRHYDARNYRPIPGWKLVSAPQQQLFFDVNEDTNEFMGINHTGGDQVFFYYKDARVIEVKNPKDKVPDGYVRVTFKAEEGGSFGKDAQGKAIKEINYDVIKGLNSNLLPVPQELVEGNEQEKDKYYISPEPGKNFIKWDNEKLLNKNTMISDNHTFTAYFDWKEIKINPLVVTESFTDPKGKWTNDFAPSVEKLKGQVKWFKNKVEEDLPDGVEVTFASDIDKTIADSFKELGKADKDELVREVKIPAKIKYADSSEQDIEIPVKVYKNVYEALTGTEKPLFLSEAEKDDLKDVSGNYVKVTVAPTGDLKSKDNKVYYVNPKAWVVIPEVDAKDNSTFINWTSDKEAQNEDGKKDGIYDFTKRHIFTEDTVISPRFSKDVEKEENGKPNVPDSFVKVIVRTTDKAKEPSETTFWVDPSKEVAIPITDPEGKVEEVDFKILGKKDATYVFKQWQIVKAGSSDDALADVKPTKIDLAKHKYTDKVTVIEASYSQKIDWFKIFEPTKTEEIHTPKGKVITDKDLIDKITPQEGKVIDKIEVISTPDPNKVGKSKAKVIITYKDGSTQGSKEEPIVIPVEVHDNKVPANPDGSKPKTALANYVKVIFQAGEGGSVSGNLIYYVSPEVAVNMTDEADQVSKTPAVGYTSNGGTWTPEIKEEKVENEKTYIFNFKKSDDIVEKTDDPDQKIPSGYVKVTFKADENGKLAGDKKEITYYVNPQAGIKLVEGVAGEKQLQVPKPVANADYTFTNWVEDLDLENSITGDREYVAKFAKGQVSLSYEIGEDAQGEAPEKVTTAKGTKVRLASDKGISKKDHTFKGWKIGEKIYQAGEEITLNENTTATAQWEKDADVIPYNPENPSNKPIGYVRVTYKAEEGLNLKEAKAYYVNPKAGKTLGELEKPEVEAKTGYTFANWDKEDTTAIDKDLVVTAKATKSEDVIPEKSPDGKTNKQPAGFVKVTFVPTELANEKTRKEVSYYVNPNKNVSLTPEEPVGKEVTDKNGYTTTYTFTGWKYETTSWEKSSPVKGKFADGTRIVGQYTKKTKVKAEPLLPAPKANKEVITPKEGTPKAEELIINTPGQGKDPLPDGTKISYEKDGKPDTSKPGNPTAKVKIEYPNGKTVVVEVPIKVVDHIVPQEGNDKPEVPANYVKVVIDTTDKATENTYFVKTYWVNPEAEVSFPVKAPSGKSEEIDGVTSQYEFSSWKLEGSDKDYGSHIKDKFTAKESKIVASYKTNKNLEPEGNDGRLIPEGEKPHPKDFIKNHYEDNDPDNKDNLPPGTKFTFKKGEEPNTDSPHEGSTTIVVEYPNGEKKEIEVGYKVVGKVVEQEGKEKPDVPDDYVKVSLNTTDKSLDETKTYWVQPRVEVTIPDYNPQGKDAWKFTEWDKNLTDVFIKDTEIRAIYSMNLVDLDQEPEPKGGMITTMKGEQPSEEAYRKQIVLEEEGKDPYHLTADDKIEYKEPNVDEVKDHDVEVTITLKDGTELKTVVVVRVLDKIYELDKDDPEKNKNIPANYIQVIVVPTSDNKDAEERYYAVAPSANKDDLRKIGLVDIDPVEGTTFVKWQVRKGEGPYQDLDKDGEAYTDPINIIKAKFVNDIVVQTGDKKPDVPEEYVKVTVDRGEHPRHPRKTIYWVNPDKEVDLREVDPLASDGYTFDKWTMKQEDKLVNENFDLEGKAHKYEKETYIVASYKEEKCPAPPAEPSKPGTSELEREEKVDGKDEENGGTKGTTGQSSSNSTSTGRVKTGIVSNLGMYISIIGLSAGAIFASNKKKK